MKKAALFVMAALLVALSGCKAGAEAHGPYLCRVVLEEGGGFTAASCARETAPGGELRFTVRPEDGKTVYTRALIRAVKAMLGDSSPTNIPLPEMPELAGAEVWTGDDSDGACFTYEERSGTLTVTGLTGEGMERTVLIVPSAWDGKPVTSIGPDAFAGAENLLEIIVQPNIRTIFDGAFHNCAALERIVIQSDVPSACHVGQGLLDGTAANIFVPREALSAYRTDYFWSVYGGDILPAEEQNPSQTGG